MEHVCQCEDCRPDLLEDCPPTRDNHWTTLVFKDGVKLDDVFNVIEGSPGKAWRYTKQIGKGFHFCDGHWHPRDDKPACHHVCFYIDEGNYTTSAAR